MNLAARDVRLAFQHCPSPALTVSARSEAGRVVVVWGGGVDGSNLEGGGVTISSTLVIVHLTD